MPYMKAGTDYCDEPILISQIHLHPGMSISYGRKRIQPAAVLPPIL